MSDLFAYMRPPNWKDGSSYKYYKLLMTEYGGLLTNNLNEIPRPDLVFCHGDRWPMYKQPLKKNIPYILIEHDVWSLRTGHSYRDEKEKIENAAAVIFTSEDHAAYYENLGFRLPQWRIIHLRPMKKDLIFIKKKKLEGKHLVYAGGLVNEGRKRTFFGYRAYHNIFKAFIDAGWTVHLYLPSSIKREFSDYKEIGCIVHDSLPYNELLAEMSQYTAGLQSYNKEEVPEVAYNYTQMCRPNKLWDYLAAGIPTIGFQGGNGMSIYEGKWGIVIDSLKTEVLQNIDKELPEITDEMRFAENMDSDMDKFSEIINIAKEKIKKPSQKTKPKIVKHHSKKIQKVVVVNNSQKTIERAGLIFPPGKKIIDISVSLIKEIKSCSILKIREVPENES